MSVLIWEEGDLAQVDEAVTQALAGSPRVVIVQGGPGSGRTNFLETAVERARAAAAATHQRFTQWSLAGTVRSSVPFRGLADFGVLVGSPTGGVAPTALDTEQDLREAIDDVLVGGPLLITIDDLQWIDPESVEALARVLRNAVAEKLLVVVTVGHLDPFQHLGWQELSSTSPLIVPVELQGFSFATALAVAHDLRPGLRESLIFQLWQHTSGNPLFLTSLLQRDDLENLDQVLQLPAPTEYARAIEARLATLGDDAVRLVRAAAVTGLGWMPLPEAAYTADVANAAVASDTLVGEFLLEQRATELGSEIRLVHALIQASIDQNIPAAERVRLHARAAEVASDEPTELRHLFAAAATYDSDLADRLAATADVQHRERSHRLAAQYLDWSSRLTANGLLRSTRLTESFYEHILAGNTEYVRGNLSRIRSSRDRRGAALVAGALNVMDNDWLGAIRVLSPVANSDTDDIRSYRIETLLAWASMTAGEPTATAIAPLRRAESMSRRDDGLAGLATLTSAMLDRRQDRAQQIQQRIGNLPARPAAVPLDDTYWLAWRGFSAVLNGRLSDAIGPLREVDARMATGLMDVGDGLTHAFLGYGHLLDGVPDLAAIQFRRAEGLLRPRPNPMTAAYIVLGLVSDGEYERATELLNAARAALRDTPWDEAVNVLLMASVVYYQVYGTPEDRERLMPRLREDFGSKADDPNGAASPLWKVYAARAHIWAGELDQAEGLTVSIEKTPDLPWTEGVGLWLRGQAADRRGSLEEAAKLYAEALETGTAPLQLFGSLAAADLARVAAAIGDMETAVKASIQAREGYTALKALSYVRESELFDLATSEPSTTDMRESRETRTHEPTTAPRIYDLLSEREREVASLVVRGMSYAQIARELFITRSTVGFHLTRIYAKTGTSTRHELSQLIRGS